MIGLGVFRRGKLRHYSATESMNRRDPCDICSSKGNNVIRIFGSGPEYGMRRKENEFPSPGEYNSLHLWPGWCHTFPT